MKYVLWPKFLVDMKRLFLVAIFGLLSSISMGQIAVQAQYQLWVPTGKYESDLKLGVLGAGIEVKKIVNDYLSVGAGAGINQLSYESVLVNRVERPAEGFSDNATLRIIPITLGADVFFKEAKVGKVRPFLDMDFGVGLVQVSGDNLPERDMKINPFLSPGLGVEYSLADDLRLMGVVKQNVVIYNYDGRPKYNETFTTIGINLGVSYKF